MRPATARALLVAAVAALAAPACADEEAAPPADPRLVGEPEQLVPSGALPPDLALLPANNNLDATLHDGRLFLAFRTAPNHFASADARLVLVSAAEGEPFRLEGTVHLGTDVREPRLLSWEGALRLYFGVLGDEPFDFDPQGMMVARWLGPGALDAPAWVHEPGFMPWRTKVLDGAPLMLAYVGGDAVYDPTGGPIEVHWLTTDDGLAWRSGVEGGPVVLQGGSSETDLVRLDDGTVVAVARTEAGDPLGVGTKVCRAEAATPAAWSCVMDPRRYDSPLLFREAGGVWLLGRRNLSETGRYDLGLDLPEDEAYLQYQLDYWGHPKRCALWRVDPDSLAVEHVLDLPSRGDTCFPAAVRVAPRTWDVYNYSSPLEGDDVPWLEGQVGETRIYRHRLVF